MSKRQPNLTIEQASDEVHNRYELASRLYHYAHVVGSLAHNHKVLASDRTELAKAEDQLAIVAGHEKAAADIEDRRLHARLKKNN